MSGHIRTGAILATLSLLLIACRSSDSPTPAVVPPEMPTPAPGPSQQPKPQTPTAPRTDAPPVEATQFTALVGIPLIE